MRTADGAKMSKTKGTGVDPLQLTQQYGTDALRYMLASMAAPGTDITLSEDRILGARAFANKIWNASRFLFVNLEKAEAQGLALEDLAAPEIRAKAPYAVPGDGALAHRWIFRACHRFPHKSATRSRISAFTRRARRSINFSGAIFATGTSSGSSRSLLTRITKSRFRRGAISSPRSTPRYALLHPVMPFLTEELWHKLPQPADARSAALDQFPEPRATWTDAAADDAMATLQEIVTAARNIRAEMKLDPKRKVAADFSTGDSGVRKLVEDNLDPLLRLASLSGLQISSGHLDATGAAVRSTALFDLRIAYGDTVDKPAEIARLKKEIDRLAKDIASKQSRLGDETFLSKAPAKIVDDLKATLAGRQLEHAKLLDRLKQFE